MHAAATAFIRRAAAAAPSGAVLEIGARNINGSARGHFADRPYWGIDVVGGPDVDEIADGAAYVPVVAPSVVVCAEVLEHADGAEAICRNAERMLAPGGLFVVTAAGPDRAPHSAVDGESLKPGEFYRGVSRADLSRWLADFVDVRIESTHDDVYATARKRADRPSVAPPPSGPSLRLLMVHPGASMSTADVYDGLTAGLRARGHLLYDYALDARIERSGAWLNYCWKRVADLAKKSGAPVLEKPKTADVLYHAGEELVARALRVRPDAIVVVSAMYLHPDIFVLLREARRKVAVLFTESPYDDERQVRLLPWLDVAWTNERTSARAMSAAALAAPGVPAVGYLPHAWNPARHGIRGPIDADVPAHDVVFVGTGFAERIETLERIDFDGLDVGLYGSWDLLGSRHRLRRYLRGGYVDNARATMLYRRARLGLNLYRLSKGFGRDAPRVAEAESLNPRAYELAAAGCVAVSDARAEVGEVFGDAAPTFSDPREVRPLVDRLLADPEGLARLRARLPALVRDHTWHARAAQIERDLHGAGIGASQAHREPAAAFAAAGG